LSSPFLNTTMLFWLLTKVQERIRFSRHLTEMFSLSPPPVLLQ